MAKNTGNPADFFKMCTIFAGFKMKKFILRVDKARVDAL